MLVDLVTIRLGQILALCNRLGDDNLCGGIVLPDCTSSCRSSTEFHGFLLLVQALFEFIDSLCLSRAPCIVETCFPFEDIILELVGSGIGRGLRFSQPSEDILELGLCSRGVIFDNFPPFQVRSKIDDGGLRFRSVEQRISRGRQWQFAIRPRYRSQDGWGTFARDLLSACSIHFRF